MPYNYINYNGYLGSNPIYTNQSTSQNQFLSQNQPIQQTNNSQQINYTNPNDYPIQRVQFATEAEVNAFMPFPNTRVMFMDRNNNIFWIKWADAMGTAGMEKFEFKRTDNNANNSTQENNIDTSIFVKQDDLSKFGFITQDKLNDSLQTLQNSIKKDIDILRKEINLKKIIQEDK